MNPRRSPLAPPSRAPLVALACTLFMGVLLVPAGAAHEADQSAIVLSLRDQYVEGEVQHPLPQLGEATNIPLDRATAVSEHGAALLDYLAPRLWATSPDGTPWDIRWGALSVKDLDGTPYLVAPLRLEPPSGLVGPFALRSTAVVEQVATHTVVVTLKQGDDTRLLGIIDWGTQRVQVDAAPGASRAFTQMVLLGMEHIRTGVDHVLFLLVLLLPAPLLAVGRRWQPHPSGPRAGWRVVHVVTAFTLGHSVTLIASARGWVHPPERPIEILIGVSILVGAFHALRPVARNGEPWIAGLFGMVHGLAFARILASLGLSGGWGALALLGFNVGVELAQLIVVALVFPSFYLLSTSMLYAGFRVAAAAATGLAAILWTASRLGAMANPLGSVEDFFAGNLVPLAAGLFLVAACARVLRPLARRGASHPQAPMEARARE